MYPLYSGRRAKIDSTRNSWKTLKCCNIARGEDLCVILGFVDGNQTMQQRFIKLGTYRRITEELLATQMSDSIFHAITEVLNVPPKLVKVICRYSLDELCVLKLIGGIFMNPSTNESMLMRGPFSGAVNMKCMSYALGNYREECLADDGIEGPNAEIIFNQINGLFRVMEESKHSWEAFSIRSMPSVNKIGWWSREKFLEYILLYFKFEKESLQKPWFDEWILHSVNELKSNKETISTQLSELEKSFVPGTAGFDQKLLVTAFIEIAVVVDVTRKAREATGLIESGGPVAVMLEEILEIVSQNYEGLIEDMDSPNAP